MAKLKTEEIKQIGKQVKKDIYKTVVFWCAAIASISGFTVYQIYVKSTEELKNILVNRISQEFKQPTIRKTIEDVAANNAKQIFIDEIQPEVKKFKKDIRSEMDKFEQNINERVDKIANNKQSELKQQFPNGYIVLGFPSEHGFVIPKGYVPEGFNVDWGNAKIVKITKDIVKIQFPNITSKHLNFKSNVMGLPKKAGSKGVMISTPDWILTAEILAIEKDLIVVAVGFEKGK